MEIDVSAWLNLALRWLHLIAGISWIGASFYFVWLDNHLRPAKESKPGLGGEVWSVHGGGFYHKQKYLVAPEHMPDELHWFKWEAYTTWLSGFALLVLIYYVSADTFLIDRSKVILTQWQAIGLGLTMLVGGWLIYDALCRSSLGQNVLVFGAIWFAVLTLSAAVMVHVFSDRGAFIHLGAMIGTVMVANVFLVIIPNQRIVVDTLSAGGTPDPSLGAQAKQRSVHNNYMTLPVLFTMISLHYPMIVGNPHNWILLAAISAVGVSIRHFFNLRHVGQIRYEYMAGGMAGFVAIMFYASSIQNAARPQIAADQATFANAQGIIVRHCTSCHAAAPIHPDFDIAPGGIVLEKRDEIKKYANQIYEQAVVSDLMPLGNETGMTDEERAVLGEWIRQGATDETAVSHVSGGAP